MNEELFSRSQQPLEYDPNEELKKFADGFEEILHTYIPELELHRLRFPTKTKIVDQAIRFDDNSMTFATAVDKISQDLLKEYTYLASQLPILGATIVTEPNKSFVGIEGKQPLPPTLIGFQSIVVDTLNRTSHFVDNVHPLIMNQLTMEENTSTEE